MKGGTGSAEEEIVSCWMRLPLCNGGIPLFPSGDSRYHLMNDGSWLPDCVGEP